MIDIHSHILWNADDGPNSFEQAVLMVTKAVNEGITGIVATPHIQHPLYSVPSCEIKNKLFKLKREMTKKNIPLTIYPGHEVRLSDNIMVLYQSKKIYTIANSNYLLLELPSNSVPYYTIHIIQQLLTEGIVPIIAHPERNKRIMDNPNILEKLIRHGALAQITAGSLAGQFGKKVQKLSLQLVKANFIHAYGSDAHNLSNRPFLFQKGLSFLERKKSLDMVDLLLQNNEKIIKSESLTVKEPDQIQKKTWW